VFGADVRRVKVRAVWDLPVDSRTFEELGEVVFYTAKVSREMKLDYADAEGMVFVVEVTDELRTVLDGVLESMKRKFTRVLIDVEEASAEGNT